MKEIFFIPTNDILIHISIDREYMIWGWTNHEKTLIC